MEECKSVGIPMKTKKSCKKEDWVELAAIDIVHVDLNYISWKEWENLLKIRVLN